MYKGNDVVDGPIYNEHRDADDSLKLDTYEVGDVVSDQVYDTHPNKRTNDTIDFDANRDYEQETQNFRLLLYAYRI